MIERTYRNALGEEYTVRVEIDQGSKLDRAILRLANRARNNANGESSALGGAFRVTIVADGRQPKKKGTS